jgi:hypothetical protein
MDPLEYLHIQMRLEGKGLSQDGLLTSLGPDGEDIPLVILAKTEIGQQVTYFSNSLPSKLRIEILNRCRDSETPAIEAILCQLRTNGIPIKLGHYKTYIFPKTFVVEKPSEVACLPMTDSRVKIFGFGGFTNSVFAILSGGVVISACVSTRQNEECAESWVFTSPEYRRMGFAQKVIIAWAIENKESNIIPFYSHKIDNLPSAKLANKLGLIPIYEEISIEREC